MTVSTTSCRTVLTGNGAATVFPFPFYCIDPTTISVVYTDPSGNQSTLAPAAYTVALNAAPANGGSVTYSPPTGPVPAGSSLAIIRTLPLTQTVQIQNQGAFYPSVVTGEFDALVMADQQLADAQTRTLGAPVSDPPGLTYAMPAVAQRAGLIAGWDSDGSVTAVASGAQTGDVTLTTAVASGSGVARSLGLRFADHINARDFGAVGNGSADDAPALNAAIGVLATAGGGTLFLPRGTYMTGSTVVLQANVRLLGAGRFATTIRAMAATTADVLQTVGFAAALASNPGSGPCGFAVAHLTIDGNLAARPGSGNGLAIYGYDYTIEDVDILNCSGAGLYSQWWLGGTYVGPAGRGIGASVRRLRVIGCAALGAAAILWNGPHRSVLDDVQAIASSSVGIGFVYQAGSFGGGRTLLANARAYGNAGIGITVSVPLLVEGIVCEGNAGGGLVVDTGGVLRGSNIELVNNVGDGLILAVQGATLAAVSATGNSGDGVAILGDALLTDVSSVGNTGNGVVISGNSVALDGVRAEQNGANGIALVGALSDIRISGRAAGNTAAQINFGTLGAPAVIDLAVTPSAGQTAYAGTWADAFVRVATPSGGGPISQVQTT